MAEESTVHSTTEVRHERAANESTTPAVPRGHGAASARVDGRHERNDGKPAAEEARISDDARDERDEGPAPLASMFATRASGQEDQQAEVKWSSPEDVERSLRDNPDLSTYSREQMATLNGLAEVDPKLRGQVQDTVARYVSGVKSVDEIPTDRGFQALLHNQVVNLPDDQLKGRPADDPVVRARSHLEGLVGQDVRGRLDARLEGASGDDALKEGLEGWTDDLTGAVEARPALGSIYERTAVGHLESEGVENRLDDIAHDDDSWLEKGYNAYKDTVGGAFGWAGDRISGLGETVSDFQRDLPFSANPMIPIPSVNADVIGGDAEFLASTVRGIGTSVGDPVGTVQGLSSLAQHSMDVNPMTAPVSIPARALVEGKGIDEVLQDDAAYAGQVWDGVTADYQKTKDRYGWTGAATHVTLDVASTIASGGGKGAVKGVDAAGDVGRVSRLGRLGRVEQVISDVRKAFGELPDVSKDLIKQAAERSQAELELDARRGAEEERRAGVDGLD